MRYISLRSPFSHYVISAIKAFLAIPIIILAHIMPRSRKRLVAGAWNTTLYADNPKYFVEYILNNANVQVTWIGSPSTEKLLPCYSNLSFARFGSTKATWAIMRACACVYSHDPAKDITSHPIRGLAKSINLWHGIPLKLLGDLSPNNVGGLHENFLGRLYLRMMTGRHDWFSISSPKMGSILSGGFPFLFSNSKSLPFGSPRNDYLIQEKNNEGLKQRLREKYANLLGIDPSKKIITYLPTWRSREGAEIFTFYGLNEADASKVSATLDNADATLIEQHHFWTYQKCSPPELSKCSTVITFEQKALVDAQELLLITDLLISDYSGAYIDFGLLERPCIHFTYDLTEYRNNDSGLAYDISEVAAGPIVRTLPELLSTLSEQLAHPVFQPAPHFKELVKYETGHACEQLASFMGIKVKQDKNTYGEIAKE